MEDFMLNKDYQFMLNLVKKNIGQPYKIVVNEYNIKRRSYLGYTILFNLVSNDLIRVSEIDLMGNKNILSIHQLPKDPYIKLDKLPIHVQNYVDNFYVYIEKGLNYKKWPRLFGVYPEFDINYIHKKAQSYFENNSKEIVNKNEFPIILQIFEKHYGFRDRITKPYIFRELPLPVFIPPKIHEKTKYLAIMKKIIECSFNENNFELCNEYGFYEYKYHYRFKQKNIRISMNIVYKRLEIQLTTIESNFGIYSEIVDFVNPELFNKRIITIIETSKYFQEKHELA